MPLRRRPDAEEVEPDAVAQADNALQQKAIKRKGVEMTAAATRPPTARQRRPSGYRSDAEIPQGLLQTCGGTESSHRQERCGAKGKGPCASGTANSRNSCDAAALRSHAGTGSG